MLIPIEPRDAIEQVALDVASALGPLLETHGEGSIEPGGPFAAGLPSPFADIPIVPLTNADNTVHVVPWEWSGDDTAQGISELGPSYRPVIIRGVTIVTRFDDPDDYEGWRLFRFVDWMDAFNQAGISVATRPIRDLRTSQNIDETELRRGIPRPRRGLHGDRESAAGRSQIGMGPSHGADDPGRRRRDDGQPVVRGADGEAGQAEGQESRGTQESSRGKRQPRRRPPRRRQRRRRRPPRSKLRPPRRRQPRRGVRRKEAVTAWCVRR